MCEHVGRRELRQQVVGENCRGMCGAEIAPTCGAMNTARTCEAAKRAPTCKAMTNVLTCVQMKTAPTCWAVHICQHVGRDKLHENCTNITGNENGTNMWGDKNCANMWGNDNCANAWGGDNCANMWANEKRPTFAAMTSVPTWEMKTVPTLEPWKLWQHEGRRKLCQHVVR